MAVRNQRLLEQTRTFACDSSSSSLVHFAPLEPSVAPSENANQRLQVPLTAIDSQETLESRSTFISTNNPVSTLRASNRDRTLVLGIP